MSASREKRERKLTTDSGSENVRHEKKDRATLWFTIGAVIIVLAFIAIIIFNTPILKKTAKAVTVGDHNISVAEMSYYYSRAYSNFMDQYGDYLSYFGLSSDSSLKDIEDQLSMDGTSTWGEYFYSTALNDVKNTYALYDAAKAAGYQLTEEAQTELDANIGYVDMYASYSGYSTAAYLRAMYGSGMSMRLYERILNNTYLAYGFSEQNRTEITDAVTDADIQAQYDANSDTYDYVDYRSYTIAAGIDDEADDDTAKAEKLTAAEDKAKAFVENAVDEQGFIDEAYENASEDNKSAYESDDATLSSMTVANMSSYSGEQYLWLLDESRVSGDCAYFLNTAGTGYVIVMYVGTAQGQDPYYTDFMMIKVGFTTSEDATDEENQTAKDTAKAQMEVIHANFMEDPTAENFESLIGSSDEQTSSNGKYSDVSKGELGYTAIDYWLYDSERKVGDYQLIEETDGYYFVYLTDFTEEWYATAKSDLIQSRYDEWYNPLAEACAVTEHEFGKKQLFS